MWQADCLQSWQVESKKKRSILNNYERSRNREEKYLFYVVSLWIIWMVTFIKEFGIFTMIWS